VRENIGRKISVGENAIAFLLFHLRRLQLVAGSQPDPVQTDLSKAIEIAGFARLLEKIESS
jgi:hypothetical protein